MKSVKAELLSPAGSYAGFEAALGAGADAVYAGGNLFGARAYAQNFSTEEMCRAIRMAHLHGRKFYLTVNTLLKNRELERSLYDYLRPFYEAGLDAVLVQDFGVLSFIQQYFPELPIHASTQMTVTGPEGAEFLQRLGLTRVVPARELSLRELTAIHDRCPDLEIESFIHGALCYSYSGQCLMSSMIGGRSGNRGRCAQPCRLSYTLPSPSAREKKKRNGQKETGISWLSMKDLSTIEILPQILEAGVYSLKIEGRMKQPQYTAAVTSIYRKYLDLCLAGDTQNYKVESEDLSMLRSIYSRGGSCTGYYDTYHGRQMISISNDRKVTAGAPAAIPELKKQIDGDLMLSAGKKAKLLVSADGETVEVYSETEIQRPENSPVTQERIRQQMEKLGNTPFCWKHLEIQIEGDIFIPIRMINDLRREALSQLQEKIENRSARRADPDVRITCDEKNAEKHTVGMVHSACDIPLYVSCEDEETAEMLIKRGDIRGIYLPWHLAKKYLPDARRRPEIYLAFPHITRNQVPAERYEEAEKMLEEGLSGFLVRDLETCALLERRGLSQYIILDHSMYTWNDRAAEFWNQRGILRNTVPLELNAKEISHRDNSRSEYLIYGYLPMMISVQCLQKNSSFCNGKENCIPVIDRYQNTFTSKCCCMPWKPDNTRKEEFCYNIIYNSLPFGITGPRDIPDAWQLSGIRLSFTIESAKEAEKILNCYSEAFRENRPAVLQKEMTRGHYKRGVE